MELHIFLPDVQGAGGGGALCEPTAIWSLGRFALSSFGFLADVASRNLVPATPLLLDSTAGSRLCTRLRCLVPSARLLVDLRLGTECFH